jgi:hypothetical protein
VTEEAREADHAGLSAHDRSAMVLPLQNRTVWMPDRQALSHKSF